MDDLLAILLQICRGLLSGIYIVDDVGFVGSFDPDTGLYFAGFCWITEEHPFDGDYPEGCLPIDGSNGFVVGNEGGVSAGTAEEAGG
ncbi:MAG: hypothetical protein HFH91_10805 [Lachnospiraceae bacterium]|nr:hypothetical protein [Lachnospiraceae bacterium]